MNKNGFTLLEVLLFLAISSTLAVIAFIGLGPRLRNIKFTNAVRGAESSIAREFITATSGTNASPAGFRCSRQPTSQPGIDGDVPVVSQNPLGTAGSSEQCVINGKLAVFNDDRITYYSIVSLRQPKNSACASGTFESTRECFRPRISRGLAYNEPPETETVFYESGARVEGGADGHPLAFGYVQDPAGIQKYQFFYNVANDINDPEQTILVNENTGRYSADQTMCMRLGDRSALFTFEADINKPIVAFGECL